MSCFDKLYHTHRYIDWGHIVKLPGNLKFKIRRKAPRHGGYVKMYMKGSKMDDMMYVSNILDGRLTTFHLRMLGVNICVWGRISAIAQFKLYKEKGTFFIIRISRNLLPPLFPSATLVTPHLCSFSVYYSRSNSTESPASEASKLGQPRRMSHVGKLHEVVCA
jgi:hypothetical protein